MVVSPNVAIRVRWGPCARWFGLCLAVVWLFGLLPPTAWSADPRPTLPPAPSAGTVDPSKRDSDLATLIEYQHDCTLHEVDAVIRRARPAIPEPMERKLAMLAIDEVAHYGEPDARDSESVKAFLKRRLRVALWEMERTKLTEGAVIWKLYNHAFVVRTASATVAFDLTRGYAPDTETEDIIRGLVSECDVLFVSHEHGDHSDSWVIQQFRDAAKPVITPGSLSRDGRTKHSIGLSGGREVKATVFPGYQGDLINDVPVVHTSEGISFAHTGDLFKSNSTPVDIFRWIDRVGDLRQVDVLMVNVWVSDFERVVTGFRPKLVVTGHENEMGHEVLKRKPHSMSYERLAQVNTPGVVMTWGESYFYAPTDGRLAATRYETENTEEVGLGVRCCR